MPARKALPEGDHISRFIPYNKQKRHPVTDAFEGVSSAAFALRPDDKGHMSLTWLEFYGRDSLETRKSAACAYRESLESKKIGSKSAFATATVRAMREAAAEEPFSKKIRVVSAAVPGNPGHAEARRFTDEDLDLLDLLASEIFNDVNLVCEMNLPARN